MEGKVWERSEVKNWGEDVWKKDATRAFYREERCGIVGRRGIKAGESLRLDIRILL
jgi:hypothetical protein